MSEFDPDVSRSRIEATIARTRSAANTAGMPARPAKNSNANPSDAPATRASAANITRCQQSVQGKKVGSRRRDDRIRIRAA